METGTQLSFQQTGESGNLRQLMRKWHRWIGLPAGIFLLLTAFTGVWLECVRFFGEEEALREKVRDLASKHTPKAPAFAIEEKLSAARAAVAVKHPDAPLDKIQ